MTNRLIVNTEFQALIPPLSGEERAGLEADLLREGCVDALKVWRREDGDVLLDGHNRLEICERHGIPFNVEPVPLINDRESAIRWVVEHQFHRRNLNEAQRAMLAGVLANLEQGGDRKSEAFKSPIGDLKLADAAERFKVGKRSVERARKVQQNGIPELSRLVTAGAVSVSAAADVAALPVDEQRNLVAGGPEAVTEAAREIRRGRQGEAKTSRKAFRPTVPENSTAHESTAAQPSSPAALPALAVSPDGLLPCAQCGSEAEFDEDFDLMHGPSYCLVCCNPGCRMQTPLLRAKEEARAIWNRRNHPDQALDANLKGCATATP